MTGLLASIGTGPSYSGSPSMVILELVLLVLFTIIFFYFSILGSIPYASVLSRNLLLMSCNVTARHKTNIGSKMQVAVSLPLTEI